MLAKYDLLPANPMRAQPNVMWERSDSTRTPSDPRYYGVLLVCSKLTVNARQPARKLRAA